MPGTSVIDDIELIIEDIRGGGGKPPSRRDDGGGGDDGGNTSGDRKPGSGRPSAKKYSTAIALAMLSILIFFITLTAAFVVLRINNLHTWSAVRLPWILWVNTVVLLASSATLELARRKLQVHSLRGFKQRWALTTILGMIFLAGQVIAWRHLATEGVYLAPRLSSSFFYVFTALHAAHLVGGICALLYVALRNFEAAHLSRMVAAQVTSYYWHFMDGLWLFLLALLYFGQ